MRRWSDTLSIAASNILNSFRVLFFFLQMFAAHCTMYLYIYLVRTDIHTVIVEHFPLVADTHIGQTTRENRDRQNGVKDAKEQKRNKTKNCKFNTIR